MKKYVADVLYVLSVVLANTMVGILGESAAYIIPLVLIAVTMTTRDILHQTRKRWYMFFLIGVGSVLSYLLCVDFLPIAIASSSAFLASEIVDYIVFQNLKGSWATRAFISSVISSPIDSAVFITIAFGFNPILILVQTTLKIIGALWTIWVYEKVKEG